MWVIDWITQRRKWPLSSCRKKGFVMALKNNSSQKEKQSLCLDILDTIFNWSKNIWKYWISFECTILHLSCDVVIQFKKKNHIKHPESKLFLIVTFTEQTTAANWTGLISHLLAKIVRQHSNKLPRKSSVTIKTWIPGWYKKNFIFFDQFFMMSSSDTQLIIRGLCVNLQRFHNFHSVKPKCFFGFFLEAYKTKCKHVFPKNALENHRLHRLSGTGVYLPC